MWWNRQDTRPAMQRKAAKRMATQSTIQRLDWADQAGSGVAKALDDYRRHRQPESLADAREGAEALLGVLDALQGRD